MPNTDMSHILKIALGAGIALIVVLIAVVTALIWWFCYRTRRDPSFEGLTDELTRREDLANTDIESDEQGWTCIICAYQNSSNKSVCVMCGTTADFLRKTDGLDSLKHISSRNLLHDMQNEQVDDVSTLRTRQRAFVRRRMESRGLLSGKRLSLRQRGAQRRRMWKRREKEDGKMHWVRDGNSNKRLKVPISEDTALDDVDAKDWDMMESFSSPKTDFTSIQSQGFVSSYNDEGKLVWIKAEDVSIDMEPFRQLEEDVEQVMAMDFRQKKQWFLAHVSKLAIPPTEGITKITLRRESLLEDSMKILTTASKDQLVRYLRIEFEGEAGIDAGGLLREWFDQICKELFSSDKKLFVPTKGENTSYWINPLSGQHEPDHLRYFRFAGILIGKALFEGLVMEAHLALPLLKHVLGIPISFSDLEFLDDELYRNCQWLRKNENAEALCLTFSVMLEDGKMIDLKENGRDLEVTDANKEEYMQLVLEHRMLDSVSPQLQQLLQGIYEIIPKEVITVLDYQELELMLCGVPTIDVGDWRRHTTVNYCEEFPNGKRMGVKEQDRVVEWFWNVLEDLSLEERARLLQFATGTSRVPIEGFRGLLSSSGYVHPFTLQLVPKGESASGLLPKAHTCFNRLDLPLYKEEEELEQHLSVVLHMEIMGFGLE